MHFVVFFPQEGGIFLFLFGEHKKGLEDQHRRKLCAYIYQLQKHSFYGLILMWYFDIFLHQCYCRCCKIYYRSGNYFKDRLSWKWKASKYLELWPEKSFKAYLYLLSQVQLLVQSQTFITTLLNEQHWNLLFSNIKNLYVQHMISYPISLLRQH